ncbi:hypothetical protein [Cellulomonas sp. Y8]|uniref:hypothetical protein n=1 Tax=Cellulomonas sp. Y8 TaxID=2591145 RepID=UPI0011CBE008|nr:hypothetical protein [Cellulomonas sp. Y8]
MPSGSVGAVAARFDPGDRAGPSSDSSEPRRLLCLGDAACPSVHRWWVVDGAVSDGDLEEWLSRAGYDAAVDGDCARGCRAEGTADGWAARVSVSRVDDGSTSVRLWLAAP